MGIYRERVLPRLIDVACGTADHCEQRNRMVPLARGRVLEVGMGTGHNLPYYDREQVDLVWGLEPSPGMRRRAAARIAATDLDVRWLDLPGEQIPLDDASVDTVVLTYTLCSIADWRAALGQMRRVLVPGGTVVFLEHGAAPDVSVQRWQRRVDPVWKVVAGGCHLDRPIDRCLTEAGFAIDRLDTRYRGAPRFATFTYSGVATAA